MDDRVIEVVNRSNQRGGRMLSVVDLIEAETLTPPQAGFVTARIEAGASVLVGASPGGAGKTAVMGALLTMLPPGESVHVTHTDGGFGLGGGGDAGGTGTWRTAGTGDCLVAYEISPASYEAYIWGGDLREFLERGLAGARLFANLHADTLDEARDQIVTDNGATRAAFNAFDTFVPITVAGGFGRRSRVVERIDYRDAAGSPGASRSPGAAGSSAEAGSRSGPPGAADPPGTARSPGAADPPGAARAPGAAGWSHVGRSPTLSDRAGEIAQFLESLADDGIRRIEDVRRRWLEFRGE
jgi:hypothetical protein